MLLTATTAGPGGAPAVTTLLLAAVVVVSTAAVVDLLVQHRGELARDLAGGALDAARRSRGRVRALVAAALVDVCAVGLGSLLLSGATPASRPLLVGLVCGVVGCAAAAAAVVALVHVLHRDGPAAEPRSAHDANTPAQPAAAVRVLAAVPPPGAAAPAPGTPGAGSPSRAHERTPTRAHRREERERGRGRQRRETVTAVETVLGRGASSTPRPAAAPDLARAPSSDALTARPAAPGGRSAVGPLARPGPVTGPAGPEQDVAGAARTAVTGQQVPGGRRAGAGGG